MPAPVSAVAPSPWLAAYFTASGRASGAKVGAAAAGALVGAATAGAFAAGALVGALTAGFAGAAAGLAAVGAQAESKTLVITVSVVSSEWTRWNGRAGQSPTRCRVISLLLPTATR